MQVDYDYMIYWCADGLLGFFHERQGDWPSRGKSHVWRCEIL